MKIKGRTAKVAEESDEKRSNNGLQWENIGNDGGGEPK